MEQDQIVSTLRKKWQDFTCDDRWNRPLSVFLETWASHLRSYKDASGLIVSNDNWISTLKEAILPNTALHSITTNSTVIQAALVAHRLSKKSMSYSIFYKVIKNHAKLLDYNTMLLKQSQWCANKTARGKAKKTEKNQPKILIMTTRSLKRATHIGKQKASSTNCQRANKKLCATKLCNGRMTSRQKTDRVVWAITRRQWWCTNFSFWICPQALMEFHV